MNNRILLSGLAGLAILTVVGCGTVNKTTGAEQVPSKNSAVNNRSTNTSNIRNTAESQNSQQNTVQTLEYFIRSQYKTPLDYVQAYAKALSYRTGVIPRTFLAPNIQNQIANGPIGATPWISKWNIALLSQDKHQYVYQIKAYQPVPNHQDVWTLSSTVTVTRGSDNAWIISKQQFKFRQGISLK